MLNYCNNRGPFGTLLSKDINLSEAFQYPITAVPLSIAATENQLRQSNKCLLRNFLIDKCNVVRCNVPDNNEITWQ